MQPQPPPTRFLPETPGGGPGIWAAHDPESDTIPHVVVLLDEPEQYRLPANLDPHHANQCATAVNLVTTSNAVLQRAIKTLSAQQRRCYAATAFRRCLEIERDRFVWVHREAMGAATASLAIQHEGWSLVALVDAARKLMDRACASGGMSPVVDEAARAWERLIYPGGGGPTH
jgi:hypothetical protein